MTSPDVRPAPYPAELRAKGWRFELDHEQIMQSDTWALAPKELRPWLLMLWMVSWQQTPCGSLPADDELIAARIGMELGDFTTNRRILMRGWWPANDGRLYHDHIARQAMAMMDKKRIERERKAAYRATQDAKRGLPADVPDPSGDVPALSHGTDTGLPQECGGRDDTGTGTGTGIKNTYVAQAVPDRPDCPHQQIIDLYHETLPKLPKVRKWTAGRARSLRARWNDVPKQRSLAWWKRFFEYVGESDFLMGRATGFEADLEWLVNEKNFVKVIEGKYENKKVEEVA